MHPPFRKAKVGRTHVRPYPFSLSFDWAKARSTRWRLERAVALAAQRWAAAMKEASTCEGPLLATQFPTETEWLLVRDVATRTSRGVTT
jgi:hypothetical protein